MDRHSNPEPLHRSINAVIARMAELETALRFIAAYGGTKVATEHGPISCDGDWCAEQAKAALSDGEPVS